MHHFPKPIKQAGFLSFRLLYDIVLAVFHCYKNGFMPSQGVELFPTSHNSLVKIPGNFDKFEDKAAFIYFFLFLLDFSPTDKAKSVMDC